MSLEKVRSALEIALHTMSPALDTAWENRDFTPAPGVAYQRVHLMPAAPDNPTMGDGYYRERGVMQITLNYPIGTGPAQAMTRAGLIRSTFFRGASFTNKGLTTRIASTPEIGRGIVVNDRWTLPVSIRYYADVFGG